MTKKKQALLSIIGAVVVFSSLSGVAYYQIKENATVKVQERIQKVCTLDEISRIEFKDDQLITLQLQSNGWQNPEFNHLQYDTVRISEWLQVLQMLETEKIVKNVEDESLYGFTENSKMITVYDSMNNSQTLHIGNKSEEEQALYMKSDDEAIIYMVSLEEGEKLLTEPSTFVNCDEVEVPEVTTQFSLVYDQDVRMTMSFEEAWYLKDYFQIPYRVKEESMNAVLDTIQNLEVLSYVGTYDDLSDYGLEKPKLQLIINQESNMAFGNQTEEGVYVTLNNGKDVYMVDQTLYQQLSKLDAFDMIEKQFVQLPIEKIKQIQLSNPQGQYVFLLDKTLMLPEDKVEKEQERSKEVNESEEKQEETQVLEQPEESFALFNDKELNEEEANEWIKRINESLYIEALLQNPKIEQKQERKAEATIEYTLEDDQQVLIELVPYDINYYILRYNGSVEFAVNKEKVTKLFTELSHLDKKKAE